MPEQVRCPDCDAALSVPDSLLGQTVKCPKCQTTFLAEMPRLAEGIVETPEHGPSRSPTYPLQEREKEWPLEEEEEEIRPRRRGRTLRRSGGIAKTAAMGPAIAIIVASCFSIVVGALDLVHRLLNSEETANLSSKAGVSNATKTGYTIGMAMGYTTDVLSLLLPLVMIGGAVAMMSLRAYPLAMVSCILAVVPLHCCCLLSLPFGIWGLVTLNRPDVRNAFA